MKQTLLAMLLNSMFLGLPNNSIVLRAGDDLNRNLKRLDQFVSEYEKLGLFSGFVAVEKDGIIVFQKGYGQANFEFAIPNQIDTRFRIASITKIFTKVAIAKLSEQEKLNLDDKLSAYFPEFPRAEDITIRQMLNHSSGIPHINSLSWYEDLGKTNISLNEIIERLSTEPLTHEPGSATNYSNGAYALLAALIELTSGQDYYSFMRQQILDPLQLHDTGPEIPFSVVDRLANGYKPGSRNGSIAKPRFAASAIKIGGGDFCSSTSDLLKFASCLYEENVLKSETWNRILPKREVLFLDGRRPGYFSNFIRDFNNDITIVCLSNIYCGIFGIDDALLNLVRGEPVVQSELRFAGKTLTAAEASPFAGEYTLEPIGTAVDIVRKPDGNLVYREINLGAEFAFVPLSDGNFFATQYDMICTFDDGEFECKPRLTDFKLRLKRR